MIITYLYADGHRFVSVPVDRLSCLKDLWFFLVVQTDTVIGLVGLLQNRLRRLPSISFPVYVNDGCCVDQCTEETPSRAEAGVSVWEEVVKYDIFILCASIKLEWRYGYLI